MIEAPAKPKRKFRTLEPLTAEQWELVLGVTKLCWHRARLWTPISLRNNDDALIDSFTVLQNHAIRQAYTFDPNNGTQFSTYFMKFAWQVLHQHWAKQYFRPFSLDEPLSEGSDVTLLDLVAGKQEPESIDREISPDIRQAMRFLTERERAVIDFWYGLDEHPKLVSREIGEKLGFTAQRARQLHKNALDKLFKKLGHGDYL